MKPTSILILLPLIGSVAEGASYDAASDFAVTNNPAGQWSYLYDAGFGLNLMTNEWISSGLAAWDNGGTQPYWSGVLKNTTGTTLTYNGGNTVQPADTLYLDPQYYRVVVRWTAPSPGTWSVIGFFETIDRNFHGGYVAPSCEIRENNTVVWGPTQLSTAPGYTDPFSLQLTLQTGDVLDFSVACNGDFAFQGTGLNAEIFGVPTLVINSLPPNQVLLCWPSWATNYALFSATSLATTPQWQTVTNPPVPVGSWLVVTNSAADAQRFYRLQGQ